VNNMILNLIDVNLPICGFLYQLHTVAFALRSLVKRLYCSH